MSKKKLVPPLQLLKSAGDFILSESSARTPRETGGILIGRTKPEGLFITRALGPGPNAHHGTSGFKRDGQYSQSELDKIFTATQGQEDYVGEWHSHPARCEASSVDVGSISWISENSRYRCEAPVLIISVTSTAGQWELLGYRWSDSRLIRCPIPLV